MSHTVTNTSKQQVPPKLTSPPLIRVFDLIVSGVLSILLAPFLLLIALLIKLTSRGPVLYTGDRVGKEGKIFKIYKFRTAEGGQSCPEPDVNAEDDPCVTRLGFFLRRSKFDELPQLVNVLRGDMSLVGPRPETPFAVAQYSPDQRQILAVRPGITGPASLHCREVQLRTSKEKAPLTPP